jgi:hypothetical protein
MNDETNVEVTETTTAPELPETPEVKEPTPTPVVERGIKETLEVFDGLKLIGEIANGILADGKVNGSDVFVVAGKLKEMDRLTNAVVGADQVKAELQNLSKEEAIQIGMVAWSVIQEAIQAAKKKK